MSGQLVRFYEFGPFCVDVSSRVLRRGSEALPIEPKVFDTLLVLIENHGKVVSKEELMKAVWGPDTFVEEGSIARNISLLRKTIDEGPRDTQCIATFPKRGYQFVAVVREVGDGAVVGAPLVGALAETRHDGHPRGVPLQVLAGGVAILALALGYWFVRPLPVPAVRGHQALTHDGREKRGPLLTDGPRLYFGEKVDGKWMLAVVPTEGGDVSLLPLPLSDVRISDIARDRSDLVGWEPIPRSEGGRLLVWPVASGAPEILDGLRGILPTWSPDGVSIAYSDGIHTLFAAGRHGESPRKVASVEGQPADPRWSPDGKFLRFSQRDARSEVASLWEVPAAGGQPRPLLPGWKYSAGRPTWTADGSYSLFASGPAGVPDVWARRENCNPFRWRCREPLRITAGLGDIVSQLPSRDGKKLFVLGGAYKRELLRYDLKSGTFAPYFPTAIASDVDFSPDGKWVVYARLPERTLWRSRLDGSDAAPLTVSGAEAYSPHWSADGKQIAYMSISPQNQYKACIIAADGGQPQQAVQGAGEEGVPTWSRDGNFLVFGDTLHVGHASKMAIHLLDLRNHELSTLPGSAGLWTPRWSPDGRYIAALALGDEAKGQLAVCPSILLFDLKARRWATLVKISPIVNLAWSRDSQYIYFIASGSALELYRVRVGTKRLEHLSSYIASQGGGGDWIGVTPDGSPLVMRDTIIDEVYALAVQWP